MVDSPGVHADPVYSMHGLLGLRLGTDRPRQCLHDVALLKLLTRAACGLASSC